MTGHRDDNRCNDYVPDPFVVEVDPFPDQCGYAGHGSVFIKFKSDWADCRMRVAADHDDVTATVQFAMDELRALRDDIDNAISVINQTMTRDEFDQFIHNRDEFDQAIQDSEDDSNGQRCRS